MPTLIRAVLLLPLLVLLVAPAAWAVRITGTVTTTTGETPPETTVTLEREDDDRQPGGVVTLRTDGSGQFTEDVPPGTYTIRTKSGGLRVEETVTIREDRSLTVGPSTNPELPGPGNFNVGFGLFGSSRPMKLDEGHIIVDDGTTRTRQKIDEDLINRREDFDLDTHVGFAQFTWGAPRFGWTLGSGFLGIDAAPFVRLGGGVSELDALTGTDARQSFRSDGSLFVGGGLNAKVTHSSLPVYFLFGLAAYFLNLGGLSTEAAGGDLRVEADQYGWGVSAAIGAQLNRLAPGLRGRLGMVNVYAGVGASWVRLDATAHASVPFCETRPAPPPRFPDEPRQPDIVVCTDATPTEVEQNFVEDGAVHGMAGLTFPLFGPAIGVVEAGFGDGWWSLMVKLGASFDP